MLVLYGLPVPSYRQHCQKHLRSQGVYGQPFLNVAVHGKRSALVTARSLVQFYSVPPGSLPSDEDTNELPNATTSPKSSVACTLGNAAFCLHYESSLACGLLLLPDLHVPLP